MWTSIILGVAAAQPPVYQINAATHFDAGRQHGQLAASRIKGWLETDEMRALLHFAMSTKDGRAALEALKQNNTRFSPMLAQEVTGIAEGAGLSVDYLWVATLINELEALMPTPLDEQRRPGHCSDIYAVPQGGTAHGIAHGHNEDWPGPIKNFWYFLIVNSTASDGQPGLSSCAGMMYPGGLVGWASTWNARGLFLTQNSLFPARSRPYGLASAFAQREAICGSNGAATSLDEVVAALKAAGAWAQAASINIVDLNHRRMANVERYEGKFGLHEVTMRPWTASNYSHFNHFKEIGGVPEDGHRNSSAHRQATLDSYTAPQTASDIVMRLSDTSDREYPIYRDMTLATFVLDHRWSLRVWCCGRSAMSGPPDYHWNLSNAFG